MTGEKGKLSADRKDGKWTLHANQDDLPGDIEAIDQLLTGATFLSAKNFAADSFRDTKAKSALKGIPKTLSLTLQKEKGTSQQGFPPITIEFFHKKGDQKTYATVSNLDPLFELDASSAVRLDKTVKDLRLSKLLTSMDRFSAKKLRFEGQAIGETTIDLTQKDGKWIMPNGAPNGAKDAVSQEKVQDLLERLSGNRIKDFLEGSSIPDGQSSGFRFTLGNDQSDKVKELAFWKKGDKLYAKDLQSKRNEAFVVDPTIQNMLPWDKDFFKLAAQPTQPAGSKAVDSKTTQPTKAAPPAHM